MMSRPYWGQGRQRKYETDDLKIIFEVALRALRLWLLKALTFGRHEDTNSYWYLPWLHRTSIYSVTDFLKFVTFTTLNATALI
ncbi:conserved hypothetical protein [Pseudomonas sp. 9Ag]|nr:conserved hypothetical protein [Pseudomonas sp. 9Ag]